MSLPNPIGLLDAAEIQNGVIRKGGIHMSEYELYHHGVKGMKWGIRRTRKQLGHKVSKFVKKTRKSVGKAVQNYKTKKAAKAAEAEKKRPKKLSEMSDEELTNRLKRLRMEEEFRRLSPESTKSGQSFVSSFLKKHGTDLANKIGAKAVDEISKSILKSETPAKEKEISVLDMFNLNQYSDTEIANASKRQTNINNLLRNWENNQNTHLSDFYGKDSYSSMVERGEGAVQKALREMEKRNPSRS